MTDREKAIVMAHTGICMLAGDKFQIFHKYVEDILDRPVWTHEMAFDSIADEIRAKSKDDFIVLCENESSSEKPNKWIPCSERLPKGKQQVLISLLWDNDIPEVRQGNIDDINYWKLYNHITSIAWMPLPDPYRGEEDET